VLARADGYQQRSHPLEIRPCDQTEFGVTDTGPITKEPCVDRVPLEIEEGAADLRSVIGTGRAYRHRGAVPERPRLTARRLTGYLAGPNCPVVLEGPFPVNLAPTQICPLHNQGGTRPVAGTSAAPNTPPGGSNWERVPSDPND